MGGRRVERVPVVQGIVGRRLAEDVREGDQVLLAAGTVLAAFHLAFLQERGVQEVSVAIPEVEGMQSVPGIADHLHHQGVGRLREVFSAIRLSKPTPVEVAVGFIEELIQNGSTHRKILRKLPGRFPFQDYTLHHSVEVASLSLYLAMEMDMGAEEAAEVALGGLLHDLGKGRIPKSVLHKSGQLTSEEWEFIRQHPTWGSLACRYSELINTRVLALIAQHHERQDGSGYPMGLKGDQICIGARIVAVSDAFSAMTSNRDYRGRMFPAVAIEELGKGHFDIQVLRAFRRIVSPYRTGDGIYTADGVRGRVAKLGKNPYEPVVEAETGELFTAAASSGRAVVGWAV